MNIDVEVRHLVVDLGGVLFRFDHRHRLDRLAAATGLPPDRVHTLLWESGFSAACDQGLYGTAAVVRDHIRAAMAAAGSDLACSDDELDELWCSAYQPDGTVVAALGQRPGATTLALLTNNGPLEEEVLTRHHPAAFAVFDRVFFSHRLGRRKPDPAAFTAVAALLGAEGPDIMLIDDSPTNVAAARAATWHATVYDSASHRII